VTQPRTGIDRAAAPIARGPTVVGDASCDPISCAELRILRVRSPTGGHRLAAVRAEAEDGHPLGRRARLRRALIGHGGAGPLLEGEASSSRDRGRHRPGASDAGEVPAVAAWRDGSQ